MLDADLCDLCACQNYLLADVAEIKGKKASKKEKRKAAFGWDVFNQDSLYKGYKKRLVSLPTSGETAPAVAATGEDALGDELAYGKDDKVEEVRAKTDAVTRAGGWCFCSISIR